MNIEQAISWGILELKNQRLASLETTLILAWALKRDKVWIKINPTKELTETQTKRFKKAILNRAKNAPLAYILGSKEFLGNTYEVSPSVLIPRGETEELCLHIFNEKRKKKPKSILDIGTGSGVIAISLSLHWDLLVHACDISKHALRIAERNGRKNKAHVEWTQSDLLLAFPDTEWDIIIANLPYIPENMVLSPDIDWEPDKALFAGPDGLNLIRRLPGEFERRNIIFKELWLEFLPQQESEIKNIFCDYKVKFFSDLGGDNFFAKIEPRKNRA